jgi:hypothetical protein
MAVAVMTVCFVSGQSTDEDAGVPGVAENATTIDDRDKGSARFFDLAGTLEAVETGIEIGKTAHAAAGGAKTVWDNREKIRENVDVKKIKEGIVDGAKKKVEGFLFPYRHTKAGLLKWVTHISDKLGDIGDMAYDRVEMWNTTLPAIERYWEGNKRFVNNTMETLQAMDGPELMGMVAELAGPDMTTDMATDMFRSSSFTIWKGEGRPFDAQERLTYFQDLLYPENMLDEKRTDALSNLVSDEIASKMPDTWQMARRCVQQSSATLTKLREIEAQWHGPSHTSAHTTIEENAFASIEEMVSNNTLTYAQETQLAMMIEKRRCAIEGQLQTISQLENKSLARMARLRMYALEKRKMHQVAIAKQTAAIAVGTQEISPEQLAVLQRAAGAVSTNH